MSSIGLITDLVTPPLLSGHLDSSIAQGSRRGVESRHHDDCCKINCSPIAAIDGLLRCEEASPCAAKDCSEGQEMDDSIRIGDQLYRDAHETADLTVVFWTVSRGSCNIIQSEAYEEASI